MRQVWLTWWCAVIIQGRHQTAAQRYTANWCDVILQRVVITGNRRVSTKVHSTLSVTYSRCVFACTVKAPLPCWGHSSAESQAPPLTQTISPSSSSPCGPNTEIHRWAHTQIVGNTENHISDLSKMEYSPVLASNLSLPLCHSTPRQTKTSLLSHYLSFGSSETVKDETYV